MTDPQTIEGWKLVGDYAEPLKGEGYVELADDDTLTMAAPRDEYLKAHGEQYAVIRVPVAVLRHLLARIESTVATEPNNEKPAAGRFVDESELAHMREACRLLREAQSVQFHVDAETGEGSPDWGAYSAWIDAEFADPDAAENACNAANNGGMP